MSAESMSQKTTAAYLRLYLKNRRKKELMLMFKRLELEKVIQR